jgi:hypothetical protein
MAGGESPEPRIRFAPAQLLQPDFIRPATQCRADAGFRQISRRSNGQLFLQGAWS